MTIDLPLCFEDVNKILQTIITQNNLQNPEITYEVGSKMGEGNLAVDAAVEIRDDKKLLNLFMKTAPKHEKLRELFQIRAVFLNELNFYQTVYPKLETFYEEKYRKSLNLVPKFYAGSSEDGKEALVMENIKKNGFAMYNLRNVFNREEMDLIMIKLGEFHGVSFALKDQRKEDFTKISSNLQEIFHLIYESLSLHAVVAHRCKILESYFQSDKDEPFRQKIKYLGENVRDIVLQIRNFDGKYKTILHGDCWSNNMMFKRNEVGKLELRILDFQGSRVHSPVLDLCYVFYASASSIENLNNFDHFRKAYYDSLCKTIEELGSDPRQVYPKAAFDEDWKKFAVFGLISAIMILVYAVDTNGKVWNVVESVDNPPSEDVLDNLENKGKFVLRIKQILEHMIHNGFI